MPVLDALNTAQRALLAAVLLLALFIAGVVLGAWLAYKPAQPAGDWQPAQPDKRISTTPTQTVQPKDCRVVVAAPAAKDQLDLPPDIRNNPAQHVSASAVVQPDEHPQSVVTIFDTTTGQTKAITQRLTHPWLATEQRGQLWAGYGLTPGGERVGRILLREDLLQIKAMHLGMTGEVDTMGGWFVGLGVAYRW